MVGVTLASRLLLLESLIIPAIYALCKLIVWALKNERTKLDAVIVAHPDVTPEEIETIEKAYCADILLSAMRKWSINN